MSTEVKVFRSTDSGAPVLSSTAGTLITVLDACLQNGYGEVTIDSLVVDSDVATVTDSSGHGFTAIGTVGPVVRISGATPAGLNGDWRITVVSATQFTFTTSEISDQTASGTIAIKRTPAGFTKEFSGTNLAAYRSEDVTGTRLYLQVYDPGVGSYAHARIRGYETMSDVNTGTGLFPTDAQLSGGSYVRKPNSSSYPWILISDGRLIYLFNASNASNVWNGGFVFGDFDSYKSPDAYGCLLIAATQENGINLFYEVQTAISGYIARSYTQLDTSIVCGRYSHSRVASRLGTGGQSYPNPADNGIHLWPIEVWEGSSFSRGMMPGVWNPIHNSNTPHGTVITGVTNLPGRTLLIQCCYDVSGFVAIDITGPWR